MVRTSQLSPVIGVMAIAFVWSTLQSGGTTMSTEGLETIPSVYSASETIERLEAAIAAKGMTVFARIDHAAAAAAQGLALRPTEVMIFGNAKAGTPLMQESQTIGIDLPLKALVYEDAAGKVWLSFNKPEWIAHRHGLGSAFDPISASMTTALRAVAVQATASP